jgi:hypothetical protein
MAVVINEFEVLPNTKPAEQKNAEKQQNSSEAKKPNDIELAEMIKRLHERKERVRAH